MIPVKPVYVVAAQVPGMASFVTVGGNGRDNPGVAEHDPDSAIALDLSVTHSLVFR